MARYHAQAAVRREPAHGHRHHRRICARVLSRERAAHGRGCCRYPVLPGRFAVRKLCGWQDAQIDIGHDGHRARLRQRVERVWRNRAGRPLRGRCGLRGCRESRRAHSARRRGRLGAFADRHVGAHRRVGAARGRGRRRSRKWLRQHDRHVDNPHFVNRRELNCSAHLGTGGKRQREEVSQRNFHQPLRTNLHARCGGRSVAHGHRLPAVPRLQLDARCFQRAHLPGGQLSVRPGHQRAVVVLRWHRRCQSQGHPREGVDVSRGPLQGRHHRFRQDGHAHQRHVRRRCRACPWWC